MSWHFDLASEIGGRAEQQDRTAILPIPGRANEHLVVLADGMGGQQDGALAAQTVVDTARDQATRLSSSDPCEFLTELCLIAHEAIRSLGRRHGTNPASTCTALYLRPEEAYWVHVGDSRLYHFDDDRLLAQTRDHTVSELLKADAADDLMDSAAARDDSGLYMCLGGENDIEPEFSATAVGRREWFMLCSDGFWNHVDPVEVARARANADVAGPAAALVATATRRGGIQGDNASLVLATPAAVASPGPWQRLLRSVRQRG